MIFKKFIKPASALLCSVVMLLGVMPVITADAAIDSIVTEIPNAQTEVPMTLQTQDDVSTDMNIDDNLPYEEPVTDDITDETLLEQLGLTGGTSTIDLILLITLLSLAPSILVMMTCFTRIIISFSLLRNAMGVQQTPPNQVMIGLALFLTLFIMNPVIKEMNEVAYTPYKNGEYTSVEAIQAASEPLKVWMLKNTSNEALDFFLELSGTQITATSADGLISEQDVVTQTSFLTVVPAFVLSEIKIGFEIGFMLYIPFLIIDIIVSTVLMSMGMMMLPPTTVSIPFKILMFVLADGWTLLIGSIATGFNS